MTEFGGGVHPSWSEYIFGRVLAFGAGMVSGIWWPNNPLAGAIAGLLTLPICPVWTRRMGWFTNSPKESH